MPSRTIVTFIQRHNGLGFTALHIAAYKSSVSSVRALLRAGASLTCRTVRPSSSIAARQFPMGSTPLHLAAGSHDVSMVRCLLEAALHQVGPLAAATAAAASVSAVAALSLSFVIILPSCCEFY